ncbi:unnamed protein product [Hymenolepis diminuta]|uniref:Uncharacterized protein n=1 Tax=Hymenolepis diminuta TaxID=6216 RepID=A0A564YNJ6_HYMDI|nr:unnamed protein product [Hymenolepis diminuta]
MPSSSTEVKGQSFERCLSEGRNTAMKQMLASSSMPSSSTEKKEKNHSDLPPKETVYTENTTYRFLIDAFFFH